MANHPKSAEITICSGMKLKLHRHLKGRALQQLAAGIGCIPEQIFFPTHIPEGIQPQISRAFQKGIPGIHRVCLPLPLKPQLTRVKVIAYGMTECGPLVSYEQWDTFKQGSVGRVVDRMEIRIDSNDPENEVGEILVRGMNVMLGYYKNPEATKAVMLPDGWLRTGDLGTLDKDGFLYIRGRSKSMILSSNGQNIYPEEIEDRLNNMLYVAESLIISQGGKLVALIYPDWEQVDKAGIQHSEIEELMQQNIDQLNTEMPAYSKVSCFKLYQEEFEKTPKRSIKRYLYQPAEEN